MGAYERYLDWLDEALDDLAAAQDLYRLGRYSKACFFSHQAAEKAVKALMIRKLRRYETIHSVAELLRRLGSSIHVPQDLVRKGEKLDRYYIPTRYPNAWPYGAPYRHYDEEDARTALQYAREVIEFVKRKLEEDP